MLNSTSYIEIDGLTVFFHSEIDRLNGCYVETVLSIVTSRIQNEMESQNWSLNVIMMTTRYDQKLNTSYLMVARLFSLHLLENVLKNVRFLESCTGWENWNNDAESGRRDVNKRCQGFLLFCLLSSWGL